MRPVDDSYLWGKSVSEVDSTEALFSSSSASLGDHSAVDKLSTSLSSELNFGDGNEDDSLEEALGYTKSDDGEEGDISDEPITTPTAYLNLVSAFKGSREKEGKANKGCRVSWSPEVYDPPCTPKNRFRQRKNKRHRSEVKAKGIAGKKRRKSGGIASIIGGGLKQSPMDHQTYHASSRPYIRVLETLACSNQIDATLLLGLLGKTPDVSDDIGRNARELLSLKLLEDLIQGARANPISSSSCESIRLDPSDRCEDVLVRILSKISQHPKSIGLELSKWDLEPFIKHKRSNMPKYALKQLKDAIDTGKAAECEAPVKDGNCNGIDTNDSFFSPRDVPDPDLIRVNKRRRATTVPDIICTEQHLAENSISSKSKSFVLQRKCHVGSMERNDPFKEDNIDDVTELGDEEQGKTQNVEETNDGNDDDRIGITQTKNASSGPQCTKNQDFLTATCKDRNLLSGTSKIHSGEERCVMEKTSVDVTGGNIHSRDCDEVPREKLAPNCGTEVLDVDSDLEILNNEDEKAENVIKGFDRHRTRIVPTVGGGLKQSLTDCQMYRASSHPDILAIEALACCNQIDATLLLGLIEKTPEISNDIGRNAREMVSLKLLEDLFVRACAYPVSPSLREIRLDPSDRCEDVLTRIRSKISQHPESAGLEVSKWDLEPFLKHKRSNMPKYALKQLKDAILTGRHSISAALREKSGLPVGNRAGCEAPVKDGNCNGIDTSDSFFSPRDVPDPDLIRVNKRRRATTVPDIICTEQHGNLISSKSKSFVLQRKCNVGSIEQNDPFKEDNNGFTELSDEEQGKTQNVEETNDGNDDDRIGIARIENASSDQQCTKNQDFSTATCKDRNLLAGTSKIHSVEERCIMEKTINSRDCDEVPREKLAPNCGTEVSDEDSDLEILNSEDEKAGNVGKGFDRHKTRNVPTVGGGLKQSLMDFQTYRASSHPDIWAIETLACCDQVDATLLLALLEKTPEISGDIGKNARELVSLKFLENLFVQGARANPVSPSLIRLDQSDRCEDVLTRILSKISQHPESAGLEVSKWDLEPFLKHKRSNMPKYALKQLKDAILTGRHSISAALREKSGLPVGNRAGCEALAKDGNCSGIDTNDGISLPRDLPEAEELCTTHNDSVKNYKHDVEYLGSMERNEPFKEDSDDVTVLSDEEQGKNQNVEETNDENDDIMIGITRMENDSFDRNVLAGTSKIHSGEERCIMGKTTSVVENVGKGFDGHKTRIVPTVGVDKSKDPTDGYEDEMSNIEKQKKMCLSYSQDCIKCRKGGGELQSCSSDSCSLRIHETCLGSEDGFEVGSNGKLYCPFCAYLRAFSKSMEANEKVSLTRKELTTFICFKPLKSKERSAKSLGVEGTSLQPTNDLPKTCVEKASKQAGPSELRSNYCPPSGGKNVGSSKRSAQSLDKENQDGKCIRQMSKSTRVEPWEQTTALKIPNCRDETTSATDSETSGSEEHADVRPKMGRLCEIDLPREQKCPRSAQSSDAMKSSEDSDTAKYFIRVRKPKSQTLQQLGVPKMRRPRIPWTKEEEEKLKEGMCLYYGQHDKVFRWKRILERGAGVFDESRKSTDFKDKWKNMCTKGNPLGR